MTATRRPALSRRRGDGGRGGRRAAHDRREHRRVRRPVSRTTPPARDRYRLRPTGGGQPEGANVGWTTSFWPGMLWLAYELTGDEAYLRAALRRTCDSFADRVDAPASTSTPTTSASSTRSRCVVPWRLTGDETARARRARRRRPPDDPGPRTGRHHPGLGRPRRPAPARPHHHRQPDEHAAAVLGQPDQRRRRATPPPPAGTPTSCATTSCARTAPPSTPSTGIRAPASRCAARPSRAAPTTRAGPAGRPGASTASPSTTGTPATSRSCAAARRCADYFLAHLPADHVAYWDLEFTDGSGEERDSSAAAIAGCGLVELADQLGRSGRGGRYRAAAHRILALADRQLLDRRRPAVRTRCCCTASTTSPRTSASTRATCGATTSTSRPSPAPPARTGRRHW